MACGIANLCNHAVLSQSVTFADNTLLIDLPTGAYENGERYCLIIAQDIPTDTTIAADVAITIGGQTTPTYPLTNNNGTNVQAYQIRSRMRYPTTVATNIGEGVFKLTGNINCIRCNNNGAAALPVTTETTGGETHDGDGSST